jgi:phage/plasmid-associated DNA primase
MVMMLLVLASRLCTCGEVDMYDSRLNMRLLKLLTGGDVVSFSGYAELGMQARTTVIIGTNHLPSTKKNPEWNT